MYIDEYVYKKGCRLFISGREITPDNIDIMCTQEQKEVLVKNKTLIKKKGKSDEKTGNNSSTD